MDTLKTEETIPRPEPGTKSVVGSEKWLPEAEKYTDRFKEVFINKVRNDVTRYIIEQYFEGIKSGAAPESIASLFSENVDFYVPVQVKLAPRLGRREGRAGVVDFINDLRENIDPTILDVRSILVDGSEAVALGELESRRNNAAEITKSEWVFAFTVRKAQITRFRFYEDSSGAAQAAKKQKQKPVSIY